MGCPSKIEGLFFILGKWHDIIKRIDIFEREKGEYTNDLQSIVSRKR